MKIRRRNGLTLTELLVVGTIILAVTALSIPVVKPMMESQLTKNGANMLATALNRARSRAQVSGRPCGVQFECWPGTAFYLAGPYPNDAGDGTTTYTHYLARGAALVLRQVEVPPLYTGLLGIETVTCNDGRCNFPTDSYVKSELLKTAAGKIQFGGSGPFYAFNPHDTSLKDGETYALPPSRNSTEYPFKILLDSRPTMAMPVCMPRGTVVDLQFSGIGDTVFKAFKAETFLESEEPRQPATLTLMFSPDGSVESVNGSIPSEPVHFLVGRWDQISAVRAEDDAESYPNYADGRNYWVSVFPQTGGVTVSQVNPTDDVGYAPDIRINDYNEVEVDIRGKIAESRKLTK